MQFDQNLKSIMHAVNTVIDMGSSANMYGPMCCRAVAAAMLELEIHVTPKNMHDAIAKQPLFMGLYERIKVEGNPKGLARREFEVILEHLEAGVIHDHLAWTNQARASLKALEHQYSEVS